MNELDVRIVELPAMRVASAHGFGPEPEGIAIGMLMEWASAHGLTGPDSTARFFGFNNPSPSTGSPNYGYEFWVTVGPNAAPDGEITIKDFPGGRYAVTRCQGVEQIYPTWQQLVAWQKTSPYQMGRHQWLEEHISYTSDPETMTLDLYMPIH